MLKRKDLVDVGDSNYNHRCNEVIYCRDCDTLFGGTRGDFWHLPMDATLHCGYCDSTNLALVVKHTAYETIKE